MENVLKERELDPNCEVMTCKEIAEFLKVSPGLVYDLAKKGELPYIRIGANMRFIKAQVLAAVFNK